MEKESDFIPIIDFSDLTPEMYIGSDFLDTLFGKAKISPCNDLYYGDDSFIWD